VKRAPTGEYAAAAPPKPTLAFHVGDRIRIRATGQTGTVTYSINTDHGEFVHVTIDGDSKRKQQFHARNVSRIESLF